MSRSRLFSAPRAFVFSAGDVQPASGIRLGFKQIAGNGREGDYPEETNIFMDITDVHERCIKITFHNRAPVPCAISDIIFSDGEMFSISVQSARVSGKVGRPACSIDACTGEHPSAPGPCPDASTGRMSRQDAFDTTDLEDGIKPNESLGIIFDLQAGITLADVISALSKGNLNISVKLQGNAMGGGGLLVNKSSLGLSPG